MTNTLSRTGFNLPNGYMVPEVWSAKLQKAWYPSSILPQIVNFDWQSDIKKGGQLVHIRKRPNVVAQRYVVNMGGVEWQNILDEKITLQITEQFYAAYKIDRVDLESMDINVFNELLMVMGNAHMNEEDKFVLTMAPPKAGKILSTVDCSAKANYDNFLDAISATRTALERNNVLDGSGQELFVVVPPEVGQVIRGLTMNTYNSSGVENRAARFGEMPPLQGFRVLTSSFVSGLGTAGAPWQCIAGTKDAISFARKVTETGINVELPNSFERGIKSLNVFGGEVTAPPALVQIPVRTT